MHVSIIIINYNTFQLTCNCIDSIYRCEPSLDFEIILVDNASSEHDPTDFLKRYPSITLIKSPLNVGFAKGNNLGIAHAKGEYVLLLNSDAELLSDAISSSLKLSKTYNNVGVVTTRLEYPNGEVQHNCQRFPSIRYKLFELFRLQKILGKKRGGEILLGPFFDYRSIIFPDWVWGTFFLFRREMLNALPDKKLADDFFMYVEDIQWCMDFRNIGYKILFNPGARVLHLLGMSKGSRNKMMEQNHVTFMRKYYSRVHRELIKLLDLALRL